VRRIVEDSYARVKGILTGRKQELDRIVHRLMEKETIEEHELQQIVDRASLGDIYGPCPVCKSADEGVVNKTACIYPASKLKVVTLGP